MVRFLAVCLLSAVAVAAAPAAEPKETVFDGKTLDQWLKVLGEKDPEPRTRAVLALSQFGPAARDAVPTLISMLKETRDKPEARYLRQCVVTALGSIGPDAKDAIPELLPLLKEPFAGNEICFAIIRIGSAPEDDERRAVSSLLLRITCRVPNPLLNNPEFLQTYSSRLTPHLIAFLKADEPDTRYRAAQALSRIGPKAKDAIPALRKVMENDANEFASQAAASALVAIDTKEIEAVVAFVLKPRASSDPSAARHPVYILSGIGVGAVPYLIPRLADEDPKTRAAVEMALRSMGDAPLPDLLKAGSSESAVQRAGVVRCLGAVNTMDPRRVAALREALKDTDREVRLCAAEGVFSVESEGAVAVFIEVIGAGNAEQRLRSASTLERLRDGGKTAVPALIRSLEDKNPAVSLQSALALAAVDPKQAVPAVPILAAAVKEASPLSIRSAVALGGIGAPAQSAVVVLREALKSPTMELRASSARALVAIDPEMMNEAVATLAALLREDRPIRQLGLKGLAEIAAPAKTVVPTLEKALVTKNGNLDLNVAETLVRIDPTRVTRVVELLGKDFEVEGATAQTLASIGKAAPKEMVPALVALLKESKQDYRYQRDAAIALGEMGADARAAVPDLIEMAKDAKAPLKRQAIFALKKIDPDAATKAGIQ